ncbi:MAG: NrfD/PsrC family molybdoenzyme membrane anchor subunit [Acidimicrobiales bacterium]|nr:NrfD/PsrC family molybdoenzyme membrane anchor subunit [Acidimicrobiales bacterium]
MDIVLPNEHIRWGVVVVTYLFLSAIGTGSVIIAVLPRLPGVFSQPALLRLRRAAIISAAACFVVIPLAVVADLTQPWRMWRVLFAPHLTSAMPYGSVTLLVLSALIAVNLWLIHRPGFARVAAERDDVVGRVAGFLAGKDQEPSGPLPERVERFARVIAVATVIAAVAFVAYTGFLLSSMSSFGLWYTPLLGPVFAFAALAAGFAWMGVLAGVARGFSEDAKLVRLLAGSAAVMLATHLGIRLWGLAHTAYGENALWAEIRELHFSRDAFAFVGLEVLLGGVAAIAVLAWAAVRNHPRAIVVGGLMALIGLYASRWMIVIGGQTISRTGEGFIDEAVHIGGREGILASSGLVIWAFVVGYTLWLVLPRDHKPETATDGSATPRRHALAIGAGAVAAIAAGWSTIRALVRPDYTEQVVGPTPPSADRVVHSICLSCDARCGNRAVVRDGKVRNLLGNPYHPASTMNQPIPFDTPVAEGLRSSGSLCLKGVSGLQYLYDPYRIHLPLKRTGPRGSGKFEPIGWDQLITEVVEGGQLFADIGEDHEIEGLRALRSTDPLDPEAPELGPRANHVVWNTGRGQTGRQDFIERFLESYGSVNYVSHTDLCQMNWYVANYLFTGRHNTVAEGEDSISGHSQLFGDIVNSEYMLFFGVNLGGGWKPGVNTSAPILANRHADGDGHLVLIDPYVPIGRHYADEWVPIKPGTDAAMVLAMIRWIIDNDRHDAEFLAHANEDAARAAGETTWLNAPYLVVRQEGDPRDGEFLRASDVGLGDDEYVVLDAATGALAAHTSVDAGELFVDTRITDAEGRELDVKSALQLLRDETEKNTIEEWAEIAGVPAETIERLADEFTSHGRKATASFYRGAAMHSMGIYAGLAIHMLNALVGNFDQRGGVTKNASGPAWDEGRYDLTTVEDAPETGGVHISRIGTKSDVTYEETTEYRRKVEAGEDPYPSDRPWYPLTHAGITTEALSAVATGYPYAPKIYFMYYINQLHSIPGGRRFREVIADPAKLPLLISVDTTISETSVYADYIVPDAMYLDGQWGFMGQQVGACSAKHTAIRSPAVEPLTGRTDDGRPMLLETFLIDIAERLDMPGYGDDAIPGAGPHEGQTFPLRRAEDYYLRAVSNIAFNAESPAASDEERLWVEAGYPAATHRDLLDADEWAEAAHLLARGGYFTDPESAWDEDDRHTSGISVDARAPLQVWHEVLATTVNPALGRTLPGCATYLPAEDGRGERFEDIDADYPFHVVTFRLPTRTKARTAYDYWALEIHPRNHVEMNPADADRLGLNRGDTVRVSSASDATDGVLILSERVRPGVIAGTHHFGHTQQGNSDWEIRDAATAVNGGTYVSRVLHGMSSSNAEGDRVKADRRRGAEGFNVNDAMRRNDELDQTPLVDNAGGATIFLDTRVKVEKV